MAQRWHGGLGRGGQEADERSRTRRRLGENEWRGEPEHAADDDESSWRGRHGSERFYSGGRGGYGSERRAYEGAGHESGMGWGPEGRVREGYGRPEHGPEASGRGSGERDDQGGFAGFGGYEGYNERGLGGWQGPGGFGEQRYGGYGDWSESARGGEPESPLGEHRRRGRAAQWGLGRSGSPRGWRRQVRGGAEEAQAGSYAGRGPKGYQRSDERIREDICEGLMADPEIDASTMTVEVKDGEVTLEGTVEDRATKRAAEDLADDVLGVKQVHNRLRVRGPDEASA